MPVVNIKVDTSRLDVHLDKLGNDVREALLAALRPVANTEAQKARDIAAAHIRYLGQYPGQYLASIYGGTFSRDGAVGGFVRSGNFLAGILESGATIPEHEILPKAGDVLAFDGDAGQVFAKAVHFPGATIPAYPALGPAFDQDKDSIEELIVSTVKRAVR